MRFSNFGLFSAIGLAVGDDTYHFSGNPYQDSSNLANNAGHIHVMTTKYDKRLPNYSLPEGIPNPPMVGQYIYPEKSGKYPFFLWLGGFYSEMPGVGYTDMLSRFAQKGFVIGLNAHGPNFKKRQNYTLWEEQLSWHFDYAQDLMNYEMEVNAAADPDNNSPLDIEIDFSNIVVGCHSSGCDIQKYFANEKDELFKGYWFLDPVIMPIGDAADLLYQTVVTTSPVAIESSELCQGCCLNHVSNEPLIEAITSETLKIYQEEMHAGHCSPLDHAFALMCGVAMCNAEKKYNTERYLDKIHGCDVGHVTAFFTDSIFDDASMRGYYQDVGKYCRDYFIDEAQVCEGPYCL